MDTHAPKHRGRLGLRVLRLLLGFCAVAWGASWYGVFTSWSSAGEALQGMGAQSIPYDPMVDYWLRMASGAFGLVGCWYLILAIWPSRFAPAIPWFGVLMVCEGLILLVHGMRLKLGPFPLYGDLSACFLGGIGIITLSRLTHVRDLLRVSDQ